ncbi:MAG: hypothetical protein BWZ02_02879 [Lentisphaerae bacterium ADurb.BinA184]|nr:MAG: hypothetical protein BWZ02_02879 [Lentisphaerae bacterium ADurb.BinA184]
MRDRGQTIRTRKHRTPRGGYHLLFTAPGAPVKSTAGALAPGVDTRGDGGYVILPPSATGAGNYAVESGAPLAPLPAWLRALFTEAGIMPPDRTPGCPPSVAAAILAGAPEGQRNARGLAVAVQLRDEGHDRQTVEGHVLAFARNCRPPLPEREALAVVASAFNRPPRDPARDPLRRRGATFRTVATPPPEAPDPWEPPAPLGGLSEPPPAWPWEALPPSLRDMGQAIEETYNVSAEMAGAAVLGVASIALGNKARVEIKRDHRQYGNLCFMTVGEVASGKTPVTAAAQRPLVEWQIERREEWERACRRWDARRICREASIRGLEQSMQKGTGDREATEAEIARLKGEIGERPPEPVLFCADATSEALGRRMMERGGAIGVLSGEARKILAIARGRYVEGGDIDLWLAGHAGDYLRVDRSARDKPSYEIRHACLAAGIMTQPDALQALGESEPLRESGFLARWCYLIPAHNRGAYPTESVPAAVAERYGRTIRALVDLGPADGEPAPHLVPLAPDAFTRWRAFHDATLAEIAAARETKPGGYLQWLGKLPEHVARLALLFHVVRHVEGAPLGRIGPEGEAAIALAEALKVHARRAFALLGADADTARARKTWAWLDRNRAKLRGWREAEGLPAVEAVKTRDLLRHEVAGVKTPADAEAVLQLLGETGHLQAVEVRPPAGKAQHLYYLCPPAFLETPPPDLPDLPDISTGSVGFVGYVGHPPAENEGYETWVAGGPSNA